MPDQPLSITECLCPPQRGHRTVTVQGSARGGLLTRHPRPLFCPTLARPVDTQAELLGSWGIAPKWRDSGSRGGGAACSLFIGGKRRGHLGTILGSLLCSLWRPATSDAFAGPEVAESQVRGDTQNGRRGRSSDDPWWAPSGGLEELGPQCQAQATPSRCPGCLGVRWEKACGALRAGGLPAWGAMWQWRRGVAEDAASGGTSCVQQPLPRAAGLGWAVLGSWPRLVAPPT